MTAALPQELRQALAAQGGAPLYVQDPQAKITYVILSASQYDRIRAMLLPEEIAIGEAYLAQERVAGAAGWDDPMMDQYNDYDAHRK